ncbi:MAG: hypothetical protein KatS3mg081_0316 [Gemmatimonadales bacterium]|nr:MAG: hypothetical protein KatS3mg081_0316 [Gemmatimonadales bacterium]
MPLTEFQRAVLADLAAAPNDQRYLAGGAALHFAPNSTRFSDDLDFFHDSEARVASAFAADRETLRQAGYQLDIEISLPGFVRAVVRKGDQATRVDWAHDSAWRFMPLVRDPLGGLLLHPVDLAINKVLTLAGRDEPRDFVDILFVHQRILPLAALCWAAVGKDPGFTPLSLLELLKRRGRYRPEDFSRLHLAQPIDLPAAKQTWLAALAQAEAFVRERPPEESGCLYYAIRQRRFVVPDSHASLAQQGIVPHFGGPGGVLPRISDAPLEGSSFELN